MCQCFVESIPQGVWFVTTQIMMRVKFDTVYARLVYVE